jgi:predicted Zn-dependent protease
MRLLRTFLLFPPLMLAGCAAPTLLTPDFSPEEWQAEMRLQEQAAKKAPIDFDGDKRYGERQVEALVGRLAPIATRIEHSASSMCRELNNPKIDCNYKVVLDSKERGLNAHADGKNVVIYPAMVDFARNENHLAFVIAHEFAHNLLGHVQATQQNVLIGALIGTVADVGAAAAGANTGGVFGKLGQQQGMLRYSQAFEHEADYVGLYILARAGYRIEEAPDFWRIMSQAEPDAVYISTSHPNNPARTLAMSKAVAEIRAKQRAGQPLIPNIRPQNEE